MKIWPLILAAQLVGYSCILNAAQANAHMSPETKAVLVYLQNISTQPSHKIISGQFESWGDAVRPLDDKQNWLNQAYRATGKWPGIVGIEYHAGEVHFEKPNQLAIEHWSKGGLVQLYLIMRNPANPDAHNGGGKCDIDLVLQKGHTYNKAFFAELDKVAEGLQLLQQQHVVVFLNMFAEMTADWFWWGGQQPEKFKRLYRASFDYLTREKGLDNLLFVFEPSAQQSQATEYYPGADFVDMVGISIFVDSDKELIKQDLPAYQQLVKLRHPMAFSQWGPRRGKDQTGKQDQPAADNLKLLRAIKNDFPEICWWMNWNQAYAIASDGDSNTQAKALLNDPTVINRDSIEWQAFRKP